MVTWLADVGRGPAVRLVWVYGASCELASEGQNEQGTARLDGRRVTAAKMLPTQPLWKFLPRIHQPLPLNQRESQRFLQALTSSFRKHLDREHGWLQDDAAARAPGAPPPRLAPPPSSRDAHRRPTDRHLRAILSNPLFSYDTALAQEAGRPRGGGGGGGAVAAAGDGAARDPLDVFDEAVARGLMTPARAAGCLMAKHRDIVRSPSPSVHAAMGASGAGRQVVRWLRASGLERDLSFVANRSLSRLLLLFMVAEGLEDIAWGWIERLMQTAAAGGPAAGSALLDRLVAVKTEGPGSSSLDDGYVALLTAVDRLRLDAHPPLEESILPPWRHLAWLSTVEAWKRPSPSVALYEAFVVLGDRLHVPAKGLERAHLDLHHPTRPSSAQAVQLLHRDALWHKAETAKTASTTGLQRLSLKIISLGLDTAQHLTKSGDPDEAQRILHLLKSRFDRHFSGHEWPQFSGVLAAGG